MCRATADSKFSNVSIVCTNVVPREMQTSRLKFLRAADFLYIKIKTVAKTDTASTSIESGLETCI